MSITEPGVAPVRIDPDELSLAIARAASDYVNAAAPDLPGLHWQLRRGPQSTRLVGCADSTTPDVAQEWAQRLGLQEQPAHYGIREFIGAMEGFDHVRVWYIADRTEFYQK